MAANSCFISKRRGEPPLLTGKGAGGRRGKKGREKFELQQKKKKKHHYLFMTHREEREKGKEERQSI